MVAEGEGFEPPGLSPNGFQDRHHRPLGHPSIVLPRNVPARLDILEGAREGVKADQDL